jgi:hypothetical protein
MEQVNETLRQVVVFVKETAPEIWKILLNQMINIGYTLIVIGIISFIISISSFFVGWYWYRKNENDNNENYYNFWLMSGVLFILTVVLSIFGVLYLLNPEFYALQKLLEMSIK